MDPRKETDISDIQIDGSNFRSIYICSLENLTSYLIDFKIIAIVKNSNVLNTIIKFDIVNWEIENANEKIIFDTRDNLQFAIVLETNLISKGIHLRIENKNVDKCHFSIFSTIM